MFLVELDSVLSIFGVSVADGQGQYVVYMLESSDRCCRAKILCSRISRCVYWSGRNEVDRVGHGDRLVGTRNRWYDLSGIGKSTLLAIMRCCHELFLSRIHRQGVRTPVRFR